MKRFVIFLLLSNIIYNAQGKSMGQNIEIPPGINLTNYIPEPQKRELIIVGNATYPPFEFINSSGEPDGFNIDILKSALDYLKYPYTIKLGNNRDNLLMFQNDEVDIITSMGYSNYNLKKYNYGNPYGAYSLNFACRDDKIVKSLEDLKGKKIIVRYGTSSHEYIREMGYNDELIFTDELEEGFRMLQTKKGDVLICNSTIARGIILKKGIIGITLIDMNYKPVSYSFIAKDRELINQIDHAINILKKNDIYNHIYNKWFGKNVEEKMNIGYFIIGAMLILLVVLFISMLILRRNTKKIIKESGENEKKILRLNDSLKMLINRSGVILWRYDVTKNLYFYLNSDNLNILTYEYDLLIKYIHPEDKSQYIKGLDEVKKGKITRQIFSARIYRVEKKRYVDYEFFMVPFFDAEGKVYEIQGTQRDISTKMLELREKKKIIKGLDIAIESSNMFTWMFYNKKQLIHVSYGYKKSYDLTNETCVSCIYPDDYRHLTNSIKTCLLYNRTNSRIVIKAKFPHLKTNEYKTYEVTFIIEKDKNDKLKTIYGTCRDITDINNYQNKLNEKINELEILNNEYLRSLEEIKRKEDNLRAIFNKITIPIYIVDPKNNFSYSYLNKAALDFFSDGDTYLKIRDNDFEFQNRINSEVFNTGKEYKATETLTFTNNKSVITFVSKSLLTLDGKTQVLCVRYDLTEQKNSNYNKSLLSLSIPALKALTWTYDFSSKKFSLSTDDYMNSEFPNLTSRESIDDLMILSKKDRLNMDNFFNKITSQDSGFNSIIYQCKDKFSNKLKWWETRAITETIYDDENNLIDKTIYGINIDITEQKNNEFLLKQKSEDLNELNEQITLIINNIKSELVYISPDYDVLWNNTNEISDKLNCYTVGEKCYKSYGLNSPCNNCLFKDALETKETAVQTYFYNNKHIEVTYIPILKNDVVEGILIRMDDITEKQILFDELTESKEKAVEADKLKSAFLANMSHEIRTPLNAIVGFSDILQETEDKEEREEYMRIIKENNQSLLRIIDDILCLSKLEAGIFDTKKENFDFSEFMDEVYSTFEICLKNSMVDFRVNKPYKHCVVYHDKTRIKQIFGNYISNAIKYTYIGYIEIGYELLDGGVKIYVKDTGKGISKIKQDKVFSRFEKLDSFAKGTGLGLSICKAITELNGGKTGFSSKENEGSIFWSWFPCEIITLEKLPGNKNINEFIG